MTERRQTVERHAFAGARRDASCFEGHFPGAPITPGAVLLGHAARLLREKGTPVLGVKRLKFLQPLAPETPFEIEIARSGDMADVRWRAAGGVLAQAKLRIA